MTVDDIRQRLQQHGIPASAVKSTVADLIKLGECPFIIKDTMGRHSLALAYGSGDTDTFSIRFDRLCDFPLSYANLALEAGAGYMASPSQ